MNAVEAAHVATVSERIRNLAAKLDPADRAEYYAVLDEIRVAAEVDRAEGRQ